MDGAAATRENSIARIAKSGSSARRQERWIEVISRNHSFQPRWLLLESGPGSAAFNMAVDETLLEAMPWLQRPVLRFFGWTEPAASFGYFQKYSEVERATLLRPLVRRPTGGGIVPHDAD